MNETFRFIIAPAISLALAIVAMVNDSRMARVVCILLSIFFAGFFFAAIGQIAGAVEDDAHFRGNFARPHQRLIEHLDKLAQTGDFDQLAADLTRVRTNTIPYTIKDASFRLLVDDVTKNNLENR